jgi:hypothetical protein
MAPFERILLESAATRWNLDTTTLGVEEEKLQASLFNQWDWSYDVQGRLCDAFEDMNFTDVEGRKTRYRDVLYMLERLPRPNLQRRFRVDQLREDNKDFLGTLSDQPFSYVSFSPATQDSYHWKILAAMLISEPESMDVWINIWRRLSIYGAKTSFWKSWYTQYEIWKVVRMFDLQKRRPSNAAQVSRLFTESDLASRFQATLRATVSMVDDSEIANSTSDSSGESPVSTGDLDEEVQLPSSHLIIISVYPRERTCL